MDRSGPRWVHIGSTWPRFWLGDSWVCTGLLGGAEEEAVVAMRGEDEIVLWFCFLGWTLVDSCTFSRGRGR